MSAVQVMSVCYVNAAGMDIRKLDNQNVVHVGILQVS